MGIRVITKPVPWWRSYTQPLALVGFGCVAGLLVLNLTLLAPPGFGPGERRASARRPSALTQSEARPVRLGCAARWVVACSLEGLGDVLRSRSVTGASEPSVSPGRQQAVCVGRLEVRVRW